MDNNSIYKFVPQDIVVPPTDWIVERYQRERENNLKHLDKMAALANEIEAMKLDLSVRYSLHTCSLIPSTRSSRCPSTATPFPFASHS